MRFTLSWLKRFLDTNASIVQITDKLTMIGLEVEEVIDRSAALAMFEIAEIVSVEKHSQADKLQICQVKTSRGQLQVVCGAPNARAGIKVVLAKEGTLIPSTNFVIKKALIKDVESCGMLCSAAELLLGQDSDGIIELDIDAEIGASFVRYMGLDDPVIEINVTPNRGDALGIYGIARDLAAAGLGVLKALDMRAVRSEFRTEQRVSIHNTDACSYFAIREIKNLSNIKTPKWLSILLDKVGIGSISPLVDVTNYICYSFGQPLHVYDADRLSSDMMLFSLEQNRNFEALNGKSYVLPPESLVVSAGDDIYSLAGIIGGISSACDAKTTRIILEAGVFSPVKIVNVGRKLQIDTASRYRFERNVDERFTQVALEIATGMILEICGGEASDVIVGISEDIVDKTIEFSIEFFESRAGFKLGKEELLGILSGLGFKCSENKVGNSIVAQVPSWRSDISIQEDLVEEIIRIYGYDAIPEIPLPELKVTKILSPNAKRISNTRRILANHGYHEVVTFSFMDSAAAIHFGDLRDDLFLQNPISSDLNYMRSSIIPNLLSAAYANLNRDIDSMSIFEIGPVFTNGTNQESETHISGVRFGKNLMRNLFDPSRDFDVYDIKADLKALLEVAGININKCQMKEDAPGYYHPTRSVSLYLGKIRIGSFGEFNPITLRKLDVHSQVVGFEIILNTLPIVKEKFGMRMELVVSNYPKVLRDFAFVVDRTIRVGEILNLIESVDKRLIRAVSLFDIYEGDKIEAGKKSVALGIEIQDEKKTLVDEEINALSNKLIQAMSQKFGAVLRG